MRLLRQLSTWLILFLFVPSGNLNISGGNSFFPLGCGLHFDSKYVLASGDGERHQYDDRYSASLFSHV